MNSIKKLIVICGINVIESEEHTLNMAQKLKDIFDNYDVNFIFKASFDKANRSSLNSYRGQGFEEGLRILKRVKNELGLKIITDIHESWQANPVAEVADMIQIPAFLCRQTDLLEAAAKTDKLIHVKKGQMCSAEQMHKCKEKIMHFGNPNVILCERGNSFGYQDLIVDPRNLVWLKSDTNLVTMDITHCLQRPALTTADGTVKSGGYRELIPYMGKIAMSLDVDGIFLEVHNDPDSALCDAPTQWPLEKLEWLLNFLNITKKQGFNTINATETPEVCILCKKELSRYQTVYDKKIRGDDDHMCKIVRCTNCDHIQLIGFRNNLKQHYDKDGQSNDIIKTFNVTKRDIIDKEKIEIDRRMIYLGINNDGYFRLLDIGAGYCSFAKKLIDKYNNVEVTCLEPSQNRTECGCVINSIIDNNRIKIHNVYLDDKFANDHENEFDIITSWHVLEHLDEHFIDVVLRNMYKCCKNGGKIVIEVPHSEDELFKFDKYKQINYMIHHLSYWNEKSLTKLLANNSIKNYEFRYVQRYGYDNYLNWVYNLGEKQNCNMNNDEDHATWLNAKKKAKNTDGILLIINKLE
jgi:2-dehydro-3-deoxyphosphooctonate aldolase (KDO 8-P synthase)